VLFGLRAARAHQRSRRVRLPAKLGHYFFERREDVPGDDEKRISDGTSSANLRINPPVGFLPYFFRPEFEFVTTVSSSKREGNCV
jgi:hypothetical protein